MVSLIAGITIGAISHLLWKQWRIKSTESKNMTE
jgi:hypothetical protein